MDERAVPIDRLLERSGWVRALARELVGDARADDLAQETLLVGLVRAPRRGVPLAQWLAAVMRNLARSGARADARRVERERRAASSGDAASVASRRGDATGIASRGADATDAASRGGGETAQAADVVLARFETQRAVAEAVHALHDPYRTVVLLRYFEDLPPRAIAARLGVPVRTVQTQLHRALELLRGQLDRRCGDRATWLGALVPLADGGAWTHLSLAGISIVKLKLAAAAAAAVLLAGVSYVFWRAAAPETPPPVVRTSTVASAPAAAAPASERANVADEREALDESAPDADAALLKSLLETVTGPPSPPPPPVRGRVLEHASARPVPGVRVDARPDDTTDAEESCTVTDEEGRFTLAREHVRGPLRVDDPRWVTVYQAHSYASDPEWLEPTIVVASRIGLAGRVVDPHGMPWPGAVVTILPLHRDLATILDRSEAVTFEAVASEDGRFVLDRVPAAEPLLLSARASGARVGTLEIPPHTDTDLTIVLEHAAARTGVQGVVLQANGERAPFAQVRAGGFATTAEGDGTFVLPDDVARAASEVVAVLPGFQAGRTPLRDDAGLELVPPIVVQLGGQGYCLRGRVVDALGRPMPGVEVRALDLTPATGVTLEDFASWNADGLLTRCDTDAEGRFTLGYFFPRTYVLGLLDRATLRTARSEPVTAGAEGSTDLEIRFDSDELVRRLEGRVVDRAGDAVPFAHLRIVRPVEGVADDPAYAHETRDLFAQTDGAGRFDLAAAAARCEICVSFPDDLAYRYELLAAGDQLGLELVAYRRAHLRVDLDGASVAADAFELLDAAGRRLEIVSYEGNVAYGSMAWEIDDGATTVLTALDAARTIVFRARGEEVARAPIELVPGEVRVVRP